MCIIIHYFCISSQFDSWWQWFSGIHNLIWHSGYVGAIYLSRRPRFFPTFGNAHESRKPANLWQGSLILPIILLSCQTCYWWRPLWTVQHTRSWETEKHLWRTGQNAGWCIEKAWRYSYEICILIFDYFLYCLPSSKIHAYYSLHFNLPRVVAFQLFDSLTKSLFDPKFRR